MARFVHHLRFQLRTLFLLITIVAWCTWQWTISERRLAVANRLNSLGFSTFYLRDVDDKATQSAENVGVKGTVDQGNEARLDSSIQAIGYRFLYSDEKPMIIGRNVPAALLGYENYRELIAMASVLRVTNAPDSNADQILEELSKLPGLTTVAIWDGNPDTENHRKVIEFKRRLHDKLPRVRVRHVHTVSITVG
jgi:hypothetical protein